MQTWHAVMKLDCINQAIAVPINSILCVYDQENAVSTQIQNFWRHAYVGYSLDTLFMRRKMEMIKFNMES